MSLGGIFRKSDLLRCPSIRISKRNNELRIGPDTILRGNLLMPTYSDSPSFDLTKINLVNTLLIVRFLPEANRNPDPKVSVQLV